MLNEVLEYREYTDKKILISARPSRLSYYGIIKNNNSGLRRALTIIAKGTMAKNKNDYEKTQQALIDWMGFNISTDDDLKEIDDDKKIKGCFNPVLLRRFMSEGSQKERDILNKQKSITAYLNKDYADLRRQFKMKAKNNASFREYEGDNDMNKTTFEDIYYAVKGKKLKNRVMVSDIDIFKKFEIAQTGNKKALDENKQDHLLKAIAAYLIFRVTEDADGVNINVADIFNWSVLKRSGSDPEREKIDNYTYDGKFIFEDVNDLNNVKIVKVPEEFISHFKLVDVEELKKGLKKDNIVYIDKGKDLLEKVIIGKKKDIDDVQIKCRQTADQLK